MERVHLLDTGSIAVLDMPSSRNGLNFILLDHSDHTFSPYLACIVFCGMTQPAGQAEPTVADLQLACS